MERISIHERLLEYSTTGTQPLARWDLACIIVLLRNIHPGSLATDVLFLFCSATSVKSMSKQQRKGKAQASKATRGTKGESPPSPEYNYIFPAVAPKDYLECRTLLDDQILLIDVSPTFHPCCDARIRIP